MALLIKTLGPFEVAVDGMVLPLVGARRVSLLARLALEAGRAVPAEHLVADIWGDSTTTTAGKQLHIVVSKLREMLAPHHEGDLIVTAFRGYRLDLPGEQVDADLFSSLVRQARTAQQPGAADALFRRALGLWRGQALTGVTGAWTGLESMRLEEERLTAVEDHIDVRLAAGDHHAVVADLTAHIEAAPLRERLRAQLMLALYRSSRPSEALAVYQDTRRVMIEELGIEPGADLCRLHRDVLNQDPILDLAVPAQRATIELPTKTHPFTGRTAELAWLHQVLADSSGAPVVVAIDGPGGIGKSALAVRAGHAVADRFSDGVLYVDLLGSTAARRPLAPMDALRRLLRSLGLADSAVPAGPEEAAARYRSLTSARDLLIVLDNALDAGQVRPLLPAGPGCVVVVTSRQAMTSLDLAAHLHLTGLGYEEGMALLTCVVGAGRVKAEPQAAAQIVRLCGAVPLALRIAAARLAAQPAWKLAHLARQLVDATRRLDAFQHDGLAVRGITGQDAACAAALMGWTGHRVEAALGRLPSARLLEPVGARSSASLRPVHIHGCDPVGKGA